jgi:magnesium-transporting ATPase (P-type)
MEEENIVTALTVNQGGGMGFRRPAGISVSEVYLDGRLLSADAVNEEEKSFGIFMHSLVLSNYAEMMKVDSSHVDLIGEDYEKAIYYYTTSKGFDKKLMESIAPRVDELSFSYEDDLKVSTRLINDKMRIISKGTPDQLLSRCTYVLMESRLVKITRRIYKTINEVIYDMLSRCLSVYAIAIKDEPGFGQRKYSGMLIGNMTLVGLVGLR